VLKFLNAKLFKQLFFVISSVFISFGIYALYIKHSKESLKSNCKIEEIKILPEKFSVIAGHAYGGPSTQNDFIDEKLDKFLIKNKKNLNGLFFTGDVFYEVGVDKWNKLRDRYGDSLNIIIAPGNHDLLTTKANIKAFNDFQKINLPYEFKSDGFNLIIEDSFSSKWLLNKKVIDLINKDRDNSLLLLRHNIPVREFMHLANSDMGLEEELPTIEKLSFLLKKELIMIIGDSGVHKFLPRIFCYKKNNIKFIVNGIGGQKNDSIIILSKNKIYKYILN